MGIGDLRYRCHRYRESYRFSFRCSTDPAKRLFKIFVGLLCRCDCEQKKELQSVSKYVVADAYFSKETFISKLCNHGFEVVTRLRRSEEHTSELQSRPHLVCRLLLEKKK